MKVKLPPRDDLELSRKNISKVIGDLALKQDSEINTAVSNILKSIVTELSKLIISINDLDYSSLHTRNIFELYLILTHISSNEEALNCWYGQIHKDSEQVRNGYRKLLVNKGIDTSSLDEIKEFEDDALRKSPYSSSRNFNISRLAKVHGYEDDYAFVYKLSSKLVHPSSTKVNFYNILVVNDKYLTMIIAIAMCFGRKAEELAMKIEAEIA
ncbi:MAG: hypothetical protein GY865_10265 [candidate division Zixibacteria bacterium]|nr:hypothetical protein [candidate division Zixibacteria bacterium]